MFSTGVMANPTLYVGNDVKIPMRANASISGNNIITSIAINEPVTFIKTDGDWSNIEYKGQQGWMISRYLDDQKPGVVKVSDLKRRIDTLKSTTKKLRSTYQELEKKLGQKDQELKQQEKQILLLDLQEIQLNTNMLELNKLRDKLLTANDDNTLLMEQNTVLQHNNKASYGLDILAIASIIALLLGLLIGFFGNRSSSNKNKAMYTI
jgi:SH3 domain protein